MDRAWNRIRAPPSSSASRQTTKGDKKVNTEIKNGQASCNEDEVHYRFTAYVVTAIRRSKMRYLVKKRKHESLLSLDQLLEENGDQVQLDVDAFADGTYSAEFQEIFETGVLEEIIGNDSLLAAVLKLSDRERKILNLRLLQNMKHEEIGDLLGIKKATAEKCYQRALAKLRNYLEEGLF